MVGLLPSTAIVAACRALDVDENATAALLVAPTVAASWMGGRRVGVRIAAVAGIGYAVALLAPFGHVRIGLTNDMVVLALLVAVAAAVGAVADRRRAPAPADVAGEATSGEILHAVSHDLRNPLSTIRAASTDLLAGGYADDADKRDALLSLVATESERLDRIVGNLLHAGRVQSGRFEPELGPESIGALLHGSVARLAQLHARQLPVEVPEPAPVVMVDVVQLDQVVANLVDNAVRVSPPGSTITLRVLPPHGGLVPVVVEDEGPGFDASLGDPFAAHVSGSGSTGLGLSICRAIVDAHGGTIEAGRSPSGGGSVRFTLPLADLD